MISNQIAIELKINRRNTIGKPTRSAFPASTKL
jgi:hypothetical protein